MSPCAHHSSDTAKARVGTWCGFVFIVSDCHGPNIFKTEFDFSTQIGWLHLPSPLDVVKVRFSHLDKRFFLFIQKKCFPFVWAHAAELVLVCNVRAGKRRNFWACECSRLRAPKQNFRKFNYCLKHVTFRDHIIFSSKIFCGNEWCCAWYGQIVVYEALVPAWWNSKVVLAFAVARRGPDWLNPTSPKMEYKFTNIVMSVSIELVSGGCWAHSRGENIS